MLVSWLAPKLPHGAGGRQEGERSVCTTSLPRCRQSTHGVRRGAGSRRLRQTCRPRHKPSLPAGLNHTTPLDCKEQSTTRTSTFLHSHHSGFSSATELRVRHAVTTPTHPFTLLTVSQTYQPHLPSTPSSSHLPPHTTLVLFMRCTSAPATLHLASHTLLFTSLLPPPPPQSELHPTPSTGHPSPGISGSTGPSCEGGQQAQTHQRVQPGNSERTDNALQEVRRQWDALSCRAQWRA